MYERKSRIIPGKEPHAAREPRVGQPCYKRINFFITEAIAIRWDVETKDMRAVYLLRTILRYISYGFRGGIMNTPRKR